MKDCLRQTTQENKSSRGTSPLFKNMYGKSGKAYSRLLYFGFLLWVAIRKIRQGSKFGSLDFISFAPGKRAEQIQHLVRGSLGECNLASRMGLGWGVRGSSKVRVGVICWRPGRHEVSPANLSTCQTRSTNSFKSGAE